MFSGTTTRATRSRISSPQLPANSSAADSTKQKTFMDKWLEPTVQSRASFQEAGLVRHGVVENMAPLGTLPKPVRKTQPEQPVRRIILKTKEAADHKVQQAPAPPAEETASPANDIAHVSDEAAEQELMMAGAEGPDAASGKLARRSLAASSMGDREDHEPKAAGPRVKINTRKSLPSKQQVPQQIPTTPISTPESHSKPRVVPNSASSTGSSDGAVSISGSPTAGSRAGNAGGSVDDNAGAAPASTADSKEVADRVGEVVKVAVEQALSHFRYPTAWALRSLYDDSVAVPHVMELFDQVFNQTASDDALAEFFLMVKQKKREGKKDNKACYALVPPSTNSRPPPHQPKHAPYGDMVKLDLPKIALRLATPPPPTEAAAPKEPEPAADADGHKAKRQRVGGRASTSQKTPTKARSTAAPLSGANGTKTPGSRRGRRDGSVDSTSSLSSAPSDLEEEEVFAGSDAPAPSSPTPLPTAARRARKQSRRSAAHAARKRDQDQVQDRVQEQAATIADAVADSTAAVAEPTRAQRRSSSRARVAAPQPITASRRRPRKTAVAENVSPTPALTPTPHINLPPSSPPASVHDSNAADAPPDQPEGRMSVAAKSAAARNRDPPASAPRRGTRHRDPNNNNNGNGNINDNNSSAAGNSSKASSPQPPQSAPPKFTSKVGALDEDDPKAKLRRDARRITNSIAISESFSRRGDSDSASAEPAKESSPAPALDARGSRDAAGVSTPTPSGQQLRRPRAAHQLRSTRSARKRSHEEAEDDSFSPLAPSFPPLTAPTPSSTVNSRAGTPGPRPAKKARTGLRVKNSPMKKRTGPSAGVPRASGERSSPAPNGAPNSLDDNDDYCASCSGNGELVCCETCSRSFHFKCVDPPLRPPNLPEEWFCNVCLSERDPASMVHRSGSFQYLMTELNMRNSSAFRLPADVREYFADVRAGPDGEYEDVPPVAPKTKKRGGYEEAPDFFRVRDPDGNAVVCHSCDSPSASNRAIIPCNSCSLYWHLDCLDPPLAVPPVLRTWRCPAHVDDLLAIMPATLAPAHKRRRVKGASAVRPAYTRGLKNSGYIEIEDDDYDAAPPSNMLVSAGHRLAARGVVLDFVDSIRSSSNAPSLKRGRKTTVLQQGSSAIAEVVVCDHARPAQSNRDYFDPRPIEHVQAAHSLSSLANAAVGPSDHTGLLVDALLAGADDNVISLMSRTNPVHLEQGHGLGALDKVGLKAILNQLVQLTGRVEQLIGTPDSVPSSPPMLIADRANLDEPSSIIMADSPAAVPQLTEGTEKSTPEAEELPVVTPVTEPEPTSPVKQELGCDDVEMADSMAAAPDDAEAITPVKAMATPRATIVADKPDVTPTMNAGVVLSVCGDSIPTPSTSPAEDKDIEASSTTRPDVAVMDVE